MTKNVLFFLVIYVLCHVMEAYVYNTEGLNGFNGHVNRRYYGRINPYFRPMMKRSQEFPFHQESLENTIQNHMHHMNKVMDSVFQSLDKIRPPQLHHAIGNGKYNGIGAVKIIMTCCRNGSCVTVHGPTSLDCNKLLKNNAQQSIDNDPEKEQDLVDGQEKEQDLVDGQEKVTDTTQSQDINKTSDDGQQEFDSIQTAEAVTQ
ncbi:uncharacterized protein LOC126835890 [Adelges cooleyi]|uniref:uncharacterized protein LOC126835890 n=1 Tax=Adelges cooleyi TaxID=133065 RepID=UPI00218005BA|nr:uncharacterized protein LOC126835890 [Adelges cooleyi]